MVADKKDKKLEDRCPLIRYPLVRKEEKHNPTSLRGSLYAATKQSHRRARKAERLKREKERERIRKKE